MPVSRNTCFIQNARDGEEFLFFGEGQCSLYYHYHQVPSSLEPSSFDGVYSIATLMHLGKDVIDRTFEKIAVLLKPGGKFLFSVSIQRDDVEDGGKDTEGRYFTTLLVG